METDQIIRASGKLCSRLFDHKPVISSEMHQFVNEFETNKAKRESRNLDATLAIATELGQTYLPNAALLLGDNIPQMVASLELRVITVVCMWDCFLHTQLLSFSLSNFVLTNTESSKIQDVGGGKNLNLYPPSPHPKTT